MANISRDKKVHIKYYISNNFGDALNPILIKLINPKLKIISSRRKIKLSLKIRKFLKNIPMENYLVIGSILSSADKNSIIWGAGFISDDSQCKKPKKVLAVRGPLTRKKLLDQGIDCPKTYGDPALLLPKFYYPKIKKRYKFGIIPHYVDKNSPFFKEIKKNKDILIIDICADISTVINNILKCEKIASSSLHGIIVSDAYKIPSIWLEFSNKVIGNGFKFRDYFSSVKRIDDKPLIVKEDSSLKDIKNKFKKYNKPEIDINKLWKTCPFKADSINN